MQSVNCLFDKQINSHIALVTSPDGNSLLAVPMSSLVAKGKPPNKQKASIITPVKILPLMASTSSASATVPTISHSKNIQTLIASAAINRGITTPSVIAANTLGVIIPTPSKSVISLAKEVSSEPSPAVTSSTPSTSSVKVEPMSTGIATNCQTIGAITSFLDIFFFGIKSDIKSIIFQIIWK